MSRWVFCGPTLAPAQARGSIDATVCGPAARGDIYVACERGATVIGLIDGYFEHVPAPWHKEFLWALSMGVRVFGAASMGALRAVELEPYGMIGVGAIFEQFRNGTLTDDDEVAVVHGPAALSFAQASEAMVNIRFTIDAACVEGVLRPATGQALLAIAKATHYRQRGYESLLALGREGALPADELNRLEAWLPDGRVDQKLIDALALLAALADPTPTRGPRATFTFAQTDAWEQLRREAEHEVATGGDQTGTGALGGYPAIDELRLDPASYRAMRARALIRALGLALAEQQGLDGADALAAEVADAFRSAHGLEHEDDLRRWLDDHPLSAETVELRLREDVCVRAALAAIEADIDRHIDRCLQLHPGYLGLIERAARKRRALEVAGFELTASPRLTVAECELRRWYFEDCLDVEVPDDLSHFCHTLDFESPDAFLRAIAWEWRFSQLEADHAARPDNGKD